VNRLRFLHIPKCAGITFVTMLRLQYLGAPHFSFSGELAADRGRWESLTPAKKARIRLFTGHAPIETGIPEADQNIDVVTMLRDPVERVKSLCQHVSEGKSAHLRARFPPGRFDLDAFLESGNEGLSNLQTRMLINRGRAASPERIRNMSAEEALDLALCNLHEKVACYGILERFDESLVRFQQRFDWRTPCYASSNRKDPDRLLRFEERHLQRIAEMNALDLALYDAARKKFDQRVEADRIDASKLRRLRAVQPFAAPALRALIRWKGLFQARRAT